MAWENFTDLAVYKSCRVFKKKISATTKVCFPPDEKWRLTDQIIRASRSVTAQIAEGHGRYHYQENIQFCRVARGSLSEILEHLITAFDEEYISQDNLKDLKDDWDHCMKLLNGYIKFLKNKKSTG
ncbi:MAG: four helix bundle protein [Saprospiraceae bacterium]